MAKIVDNKLRAARKAAGLTLEELAERIGVHFTTIAKYERSQRPLRGDVLHQLAEALNVPASDLVDEMPMSLPARMVPIIGTIAAGNWREAILDPVGYIPGPSAPSRSFALEPQGDSMNLVVGEGAVVVVDPDQLDLLDGRLYAIMNGGGETTFKRFRASPPRLEPVSTNPEHKEIPLGREPFTVIGRVILQVSQL